MKIFPKNNISKVNYDIRAGTELLVPLKCECPDKVFDVGLKYLVTYPFISGDDTEKVSEKFNIFVVDIWGANHLCFNLSAVSNTNFLVPLKGGPSINFIIHDSDQPTPGFFTNTNNRKIIQNPETKETLHCCFSCWFFFSVCCNFSCLWFIYKGHKEIQGREKSFFDT